MSNSESRSSRWSKCRAIFSKLFTVLGALTFVAGVLAAGVVSVTCWLAKDVPSTTVLELRLDAPLSEGNADDPIARLLGGEARTLQDTVDALDRARADERVSGVVAYLGAGTGGMAKAQELRDAVIRFRESGKFAIAFAETFGEMGPGTQGYYVASAFDEVWMQPTGQVGLVGLMSSSMFFKGTLDELDVEVLGDRRSEYKNAFNAYTERRYTPAHEEAVRVLLDDLLVQIRDGIAADRDVPLDTVARWIDEGPYLAADAEALGIVDRLGYRDEVIAAAKERAGEGAALLFAEAYLERAGAVGRADGKLALVYGVGAVSRGSGGADPLSGSRSMGSDTVAAAIRAASEDEDVSAIVFRVDSPGGSAVASDTIWRAVALARQRGKPVIVSMGNVAASGGYYVAAGANKIVAQPGTITGSIGVFAGKPNLRKLWNKAGVTFDTVATSDNALAYSTVHGYDEAGWASLQSSLDQIYETFKARVAAGRGLTAEEVEEISKGRVWSGARAHALGLVDALGGMETAVALAREEAGVPEQDTIELVVFPAPQSWFSRLLGRNDRENSESVQSVSRSSQLDRLQEWASTLEDLGLGPRDRGLLRMPSLTVSGGNSNP